MSGPATSFTFRAAPGGLLLVTFGYVSCPDICPATLANLRRALTSLGPDSSRVEVAFVTVDPARDSAAVLAPYLHSFIPAGHPLRPDTQAQLARAESAFNALSSVTRQPDGSVEVSHTPLSYLVGDRGELLLTWDFGTPPADLAADLRRMLRGEGGQP